MELITKEDCSEAFSTIEELLERFKFIQKNYKPVLNGEIYLTGKQVCKHLNITKRTLQVYRDTRQISYIPLFCKILYPESDLILLLEENFIERLK